MLDEKDLQAIAALMDAKLEKQKQEIIGKVDVKLKKQKKEIIGEVNVLMESYFDPKFSLLAERMASDEVVTDLDDRVTDLENDVRELKMAQ